MIGIKSPFFACAWDLFQQTPWVFSCFGSLGGGLWELSRTAKTSCFPLCLGYSHNKTHIFSCFAPPEGLGGRLWSQGVANPFPDPTGKRGHRSFGLHFAVISGSKIDKFGYRFCDTFYDVFFVAVGAFWNRLWSHFGVQKCQQCEIPIYEKSLFYVSKSYDFEVWRGKPRVVNSFKIGVGIRRRFEIDCYRVWSNFGVHVGA